MKVSRKGKPAAVLAGLLQSWEAMALEGTGCQALPVVAADQDIGLPHNWSLEKALPCLVLI